MTFYDELYFEITLRGEKSELKRFVKFLKSGEFDDFMEVTNDYICYDDDFSSTPEDGQTEIVFTNDDIPVEIETLRPEEFAERFCAGSGKIDVVGHLYDVEGEEFNFESPVGDNSYTNSRDVKKFNDELDEAAEREEEDEI